LEEDEGVEDALSNNEQDHKHCLVDLDRARKRADSGTKSVVGRLKELVDGEREAVGGELIPTARVNRVKDGYAPRIMGVKLEWLLMKLEFGKEHDNAILDDED
jgi:hypothetical protein